MEEETAKSFRDEYMDDQNMESGDDQHLNYSERSSNSDKIMDEETVKSFRDDQTVESFRDNQNLNCSDRNSDKMMGEETVNLLQMTKQRNLEMTNT